MTLKQLSRRIYPVEAIYEKSFLVYYFWRNYLRKNHPDILKKIDCEFKSIEEIQEMIRREGIYYPDTKEGK